MSDTNTWPDGDPAGDPFAAEAVEAAIAQSLRRDTPATPSAELIRTLADAYALPPAADAALARSRAALARRAEALSLGEHHTGGHQMISSDTWPAPTSPVSRPPQPPRRRLSPSAAFLRTAAAALVVALLGASFYALLHGMQRQVTHPQPTPTATLPPVSPTATPNATPNAPTPTTVPSQPPAPAGVYVTAPNTLFAIDPSTGAIQQRYPFTSSGQAVVGIPVVTDGVVYFTYTSTVSPWESEVVALSASSGNQIWRMRTVSGLTQLTLVGGVLYGGTEGTGTGSDTFYALRASDGSVLWTYHTPTLRPPAVVVGGVVYLMDQPQQPDAPGEAVRALRASDGAQTWETPLPQACGSADDEVVDAGMVFVTCHALGDMGQGGNGSVYGLRASDGAVVWHITTNGEPNSGLAAGAGLVYVSPGGKNAAGSNASGLYALDEASGVVRWQIPNGNGWPVFDGSTVYAGLGNNLAAFSASSGRMVWTYPWGSQRIEARAPVIASGVVYEILNEQIVAISAANGSVLWRSPALVSQQQGLGGLSVVAGG